MGSRDHVGGYCSRQQKGCAGLFTDCGAGTGVSNHPTAGVELERHSLPEGWIHSFWSVCRLGSVQSCVDLAATSPKFQPWSMTGRSSCAYAGLGIEGCPVGDEENVFLTIIGTHRQCF